MLHLNAHSVYSYKESILYLEDIARISKERGYKSFAVTDINSMTGFIKGARISAELGMKIIQGMDVLITPSDEFYKGKLEEKVTFLNKESRLKRTTDEMREKYAKEIDYISQIDSVPYYTVTLIAKNQNGLKNLIEIYNKLKFEYDNWTVDKQIIFENAEDLICLQGGYNSDIAHILKNLGFEEAKEELLKWKKTFGDNLFGKLEYDTSEEMLNLLESEGIKLVASNDCRHINKDDMLDYRLFANIFSPNHIESFREYSWLLTKEEFYSIIQEDKVKERFEEAVDNIHIIENLCEEFWFPQAKPLEDCSEELRRKCYEGWEKLRKGTPREQESLERMNYELDIINSKGFSQYFLKVLKIIEVANELGVLVGPARGSGGGSEVNFLLGITKVDPLQYGLYFERFLNPGRPGYPDIDLDFASMPLKTKSRQLTTNHGND